MSKIAVLLTNMFEDDEYRRPVESFQEKGHEIIHVGLKKDETVRGEKKDTLVTIDRSVDDISVDDFDALFIPGGYSPDKLRIHSNAVTFVSDFVTKGKPVFTICHAPQILITADVIKGRKITGWKSIVKDIENAGAEFVDNEVVVDENLVSSRNPSDIPAFIEACLKKLDHKK